MKEQCSTCKYFIPHYVKHVTTYTKISAGHCIQKRSKIISDDRKKCENYFKQTKNV